PDPWQVWKLAALVAFLIAAPRGDRREARLAAVIEGFDFTFDSKLNKAQVFDLATYQFIELRESLDLQSRSRAIAIGGVPGSVGTRLVKSIVMDSLLPCVTRARGRDVDSPARSCIVRVVSCVGGTSASASRSPREADRALVPTGDSIPHGATR